MFVRVHRLCIRRIYFLCSIALLGDNYCLFSVSLVTRLFNKVVVLISCAFVIAGLVSQWDFILFCLSSRTRIFREFTC